MCLRCTLVTHQIHLPSPSLALDQRRKHNILEANLLTQTRLLKVARHCVMGFAGRYMISSLVERQLKADTDDGSYARPCFAGANASLTRSYPR
jgi:hypothetical protein